HERDQVIAALGEQRPADLVNIRNDRVAIHGTSYIASGDWSVECAVDLLFRCLSSSSLTYQSRNARSRLFRVFEHSLQIAPTFLRDLGANGSNLVDDRILHNSPPLLRFASNAQRGRFNILE